MTITTFGDATLEQLRDRAAITDLVTGLARWLDEQRWDDAADFFTSDLTIDTPGGTAEGRDACVAQASRHAARSQHLITNLSIELDGDAARVEAGAFGAVADRDGVEGTLELSGGTYHFGLRRTADGWRIASLVARPIWQDTRR